MFILTQYGFFFFLFFRMCRPYAPTGAGRLDDECCFLVNQSLLSNKDVPIRSNPANTLSVRVNKVVVVVVVVAKRYINELLNERGRHFKQVDNTWRFLLC